MDNTRTGLAINPYSRVSTLQSDDFRLSSQTIFISRVRRLSSDSQLKCRIFTRAWVTVTSHVRVCQFTCKWHQFNVRNYKPVYAQKYLLVCLSFYSLKLLAKKSSRQLNRIFCEDRCHAHFQTNAMCISCEAYKAYYCVLLWKINSVSSINSVSKTC